MLLRPIEMADARSEKASAKIRTMANMTPSLCQNHFGYA